MVAFDFDLRKNFDASIANRFGDQPIIRVPNLHPQVRNLLLQYVKDVFQCRYFVHSQFFLCLVFCSSALGVFVLSTLHTVGMLALEALQVENLTLRIGTSHSKSEAWDKVMKSPHV